MRRAAMVVTWLCAGHAIAGGLFVALVNVPDANAALLAGSALLVVAIVAVLALTDATALQWFARGTTLRAAIGRAARAGVPALLAAVLLYAAIAAGVHAGDRWHAARSGEIDAWILSVFGSTRTAWVHRGLDALWFALGAIVGVSLALALFSALIVAGVRALFSVAWVRAACSRAQLGTVALAVVVFVALPWRAAHWRPEGLPPDWTEVAFVAVKLGAIYLLAHIGWALMLFVAGRTAGRATLGPAARRDAFP
jgi:hypothetical protein